MKIVRHIFLGIVLIAILVVGSSFALRWYMRIPPRDTSPVYGLAKEKATSLKRYASHNGYDTKYCFLVDYSIPSGTPRFFIWNFATSKIEYSDYCMHGLGKGSTVSTPVFSNEIGSKCSSLGRFAIRKNRYGKKLGVNRSRLMIGLDKTNSNAQSRGILIHDSHFLDGQIFLPRRYIPLNGGSCSWCVTITMEGFKKVKKVIASSSKEILLWAYCECEER